MYLISLYLFFFLMRLRPPNTTPTDPLLSYTTLFRPARTSRYPKTYFHRPPAHSGSRRAHVQRVPAHAPHRPGLNGPPHALPSHLWPQPLRGIIHAAFSVRQALPLCAPELHPTGAWQSRDPLHATG